MLLTDAQGIGNNASNSFLDHAPDLLNQDLCGLCQGICISKSPLGMCEHLNCIFHPTPISVISLFYLIIDKDGVCHLSSFFYKRFEFVWGQLVSHFLPGKWGVLYVVSRAVLLSNRRG